MKEFNRDQIVIITGTSNQELAATIGKHLDIDVYCAVRKRHSDGEANIQIPVNVREKRVYIIQSTSPPNVDGYIMEMMGMIGAAKKASAEKVIGVFPYYGYQRSDKKDSPRVPLMGKLVTDMYAIAGINKMISVDLHNEALENAAPNSVPWDIVYSSQPIVEALREGDILDVNDITVGTPDAGGLKRARKQSEFLRSIGRFNVSDIVPAADKIRYFDDNDTSITKKLLNNYKGINVILTDDQCSSGKTLVDSAISFTEAGAASVYAIVGHNLCLPGSVKRIEDSPIVKVITTDTIKQTDEVLDSKKFEIISVAELLAGVIFRTEIGSSVSEKYILPYRGGNKVEPIFKSSNYLRVMNG